MRRADGATRRHRGEDRSDRRDHHHGPERAERAPQPRLRAPDREPSEEAAVARVRLRPGQGAITVNKRALEDYFPSASHRQVIAEPLRLTTTAENYDVDCTRKVKP